MNNLKNTNDRQNEYKAAIEHAVVAALKLARLRDADVVVGFLFDALVIVPIDIPVHRLVAIVCPEATAAGLKAQVADHLAYEATRLAMAARRPAIEVVDATCRTAAAATDLN